MTGPRVQLLTEPLYALPLAVGTITSLAPGATPTGQIVSGEAGQVLNLALPQGPLTLKQDSTALVTLGLQDGVYVLGLDPKVTAGYRSLSVRDFGAVGDGVTDDTAAIQAAINAAAAARKLLTFPAGAGNYMATQLSIPSGLMARSENLAITLQQIAATNAPFISTPAGALSSDIHLSNLVIDGNYPQNTSGDTLTLTGSRKRLVNIAINNAAGNALVTNPGPPIEGYRVDGVEDFFSTINIHSPAKSGWVHNGSPDGHYESIIICNAGMSQDNSFYGMYLSSNGRFFNCHNYNLDNAVNIAIAGVYVASSGNTFSGCHFEGGKTALIIAGGLNSFSSCVYYAPRASYAVQMLGIANRLTGTMGAGAATANPNYCGILLHGSYNEIEVTDTGCLNGSIDFTGETGSGGGGNIVKIRGYRSSGPGYTGTPAPNDDVDLMIGNASSAGRLRQNAP